jgi:gluconolactonase
MTSGGDRFRLFASGLAAPEGPVLGPNNWILNVCSLDRPGAGLRTRGGDIAATHWTRPGQSKILFNLSTDSVASIPAALAFGPDECLYITDEGRRAIVRVSPDGEQIDLISEYDGRRLNGPNDLCFDREGNLFFSDPWTSSLENPIGCVYGFDWGAKKLYQIDSGMAFPNGVAIRGNVLYVAETLTQTIWAYDIIGSGRAANRSEFCKLPLVVHEGWQGPDGFAFSEDGSLFVANVGAGCIRVFDPSGALMKSIEASGVIPTNVCFAGPNRDTLAVTVDDRDEMILIDIGVVGQLANFCPSADPDHAWAKGALAAPIDP